MRVATSQSLTTGNNVNIPLPPGLDPGGAQWLMIYVKSDKALTGQVKISPLSPKDTTQPAAADFFNLGGTFSVVANTPYVGQVNVAGADAVVVNLANAAGSTATIDCWLAFSAAPVTR